MQQLTNQILMIKPANFGFNEQTAGNNAFQSTETVVDTEALKQIARTEFDVMVNMLTSRGIHVTVIEDTPTPIKPDAVFPNNWISFHENGTLITYPMFAPNRRIERREDIIEAIEKKFKVNSRYSFEFYEEGNEPLFLEGTGSMIFDREYGIVYACLSRRTDAVLIDKFNVLMGTNSCVFTALDRHNKEIYHTNVMMALGQDFVVICLESIPNPESKKQLLTLFEKTGKEVIDITLTQMEAFAGNMLEVKGLGGKRYLCMSNTAYQSLTNHQKEALSAKTNILSIPIDHIEKYGGGSVRCMMAEIFLPTK